MPTEPPSDALADAPAEAPEAVVELDAVDVAVDGVPVLTGLDWTIRAGERWVIVGPNGSGKTTLLRLLSSWLRPWSGRAVVLGETLGRTDMRALRRRVGYTSQALTDLLRPTMTPHEVVLAAPNGALETWWHAYGDDQHADASAQLRLFGIDEETEHRPLRTLSSGERQRVLLARAFTGRPGIVVLDEPTAGLDVGGREDLLRRLDAAADTTAAPLVLVTHHLEEIPAAFDRVVLLDRGRISGLGPAASLLTSQRLSDLYGVALDVACRDGRWSAVAAG
ncbi:MAG TPA: iron ABC transporter ATP-binding protein [Acidimicrobiaceae bacterium]|nr:iron ABC transporter ATP-binding protein [Acidimicrobiaceae bacterium]